MTETPSYAPQPGDMEKTAAVASFVITEYPLLTLAQAIPHPLLRLIAEVTPPALETLLFLRGVQKSRRARTNIPTPPNL